MRSYAKPSMWTSSRIFPMSDIGVAVAVAVGVGVAVAMAVAVGVAVAVAVAVGVAVAVAVDVAVAVAVAVGVAVAVAVGVGVAPGAGQVAGTGLRTPPLTRTSTSGAKVKLPVLTAPVESAVKRLALLMMERVWMPLKKFPARTVMRM